MRYTLSLLDWGSVTHIQVDASRDVFVIRPCDADSPDAITLASGGKSKNALIRIGPITDALCIEPGERFSIDIDVEGEEIAGEWPEDLRTRMSVRE